MSRSYRDLKVWQLGIDLTVYVYQVTKSFPKSEMFGLVNQMRRAASSIPANIAEGCSRRHEKDFVRFLRIAKGSLGELDSFVRVAQQLAYLSNENATALDERIAEVGRMLSGLIGSMEERYER